MALQPQTVSLNLSNTLDQKDDDFVSAPNSFDEIIDWRYDKDGRLAKRFALEQLPTTKVLDATNPISIGSSNIPSLGFSHRDQLLLENKGCLYNYSENESGWVFKSHYYPMRVTSKVGVAVEEDIQQFDAVSYDGYTVYLYQKRVNEAQQFRLSYKVVEQSTGMTILDDVTIRTSTLGAGDLALWPQLVAFSSTLYVIYAKTSNQIAIRGLNVTTGAVTSENVLQTNCYVAGSYPAMQVHVATIAGVGQRAYVAYRTTGSVTASIFAFDTNGTIDAALTYSDAVTPYSGFGLRYFSHNNYLAFAYSTVSGNVYTVQMRYLTVTSGSIVSSHSFTTTSELLPIYPRYIFGYDGTNVVLCYQVYKIQPYYTGVLNGSNTLQSTDYEYEIRAIVVNASNVSSTKLVGRGLSMVAQAIDHTERETFYLPVVNTSETAGGAYLLDVMQGKDEQGAYAQAYFTKDVASDFGQGVYATPSQVISLGSGKYIVPTLQKVSLVSFLGSTAFFNGISANTIELNPENSPATVFAADTTFMTGGYLSTYDGVTHQENNFFVQPERIGAVTTSSNALIAVATVQEGDASNPEISTVQFLAGGDGIATILAASPYVLFVTRPGGGTNAYYFWFQVQGQGTQPSPPGSTTGILVSLDGNESPYDVALKAVQAAIGTVVGATFNLSNDGLITITNSDNGTASNISLVGGTTILTLSAGTYSYRATYRWTDANGKVIRSAVSDAVSVTTTGFPVSVYAQAYPFTNRDEVEKCFVEIYRTTNGGTTYYKITSDFFEKSFDLDVAAIGYFDNLSDSLLQSNEVLYTTGGIVENAQVPACEALQLFKNRVVVSTDDENLVLYSKPILNNEAVEFSDLFQLSTEEDGQQIRALFQLDDKLIVGKEKKIIAYAGDGANEIGQGESWSQPLVVASDVGMISQVGCELAPQGLFFQSAMGISLLDRGLNVTYPGEMVKDYNGIRVKKAQIIRDSDELREIRFVLDSGTEGLAFNYLKGKWCSYTRHVGDSACLWRGAFVVVNSSGGVFVEDSSAWIDTVAGVATSYNPILETSWLKVKNIQDFSRVWRVSVLGRLKSAHTLKYQIYYDYDLTNFDAYNFASSNIAGSSPDDTVYQPQINLERQKCQSIKIRLEVDATGSNSEECLDLIDMSFLVGVKAGLNKVKAAKKL